MRIIPPLQDHTIPPPLTPANRRYVRIPQIENKPHTAGSSNWQEFAAARKFEDMRNLTYEEALRRCEYMNSQLTKSQERRGTKYEFEQQ